MKRLLSLASVAILAACGQEAPLAAPEAPDLLIGDSPLAPLSIDYVKFETGPGTGIWTGRVSGDVFGGLQTQVLEVTEHRGTWELRTLWQVFAFEPSHSFDAEMSGTLDLQTGALRLSGRVISGALQGASVSNRGQLTGVDPLSGGTVFEGSLRIALAPGN